MYHTLELYMTSVLLPVQNYRQGACSSQGRAIIKQCTGLWRSSTIPAQRHHRPPFLVFPRNTLFKNIGKLIQIEFTVLIQVHVQGKVLRELYWSIFKGKKTQRGLSRLALRDFILLCGEIKKAIVEKDKWPRNYHFFL